MKIRIINNCEDIISIVKEVTEEQYYFLLGISEELNIQTIAYLPTSSIISIK